MAFMKRLLCLHCGARPAPALELLPFPHLNGVRHNGQGVLCPLPLPTPSCSQFPAPSACSSCCCCCCSFSHFLFPLPAPLFSLSLLPCLPLLLLLPCSTSLPVVWHAPLPLSSLSHASVNLPSSSLSLLLLSLLAHCFCHFKRLPQLQHIRNILRIYRQQERGVPRPPLLFTSSPLAHCHFMRCFCRAL